MIPKEFKERYRTPEGLRIDELREPGTNESVREGNVPYEKTIDPQRKDEENKRILKLWA